MDYPFMTSVQNLGQVSASDWVEQIGEDAWSELRDVGWYGAGRAVIVLGEETGPDDGNPAHAYYSIKLPSGRIIDAISGIHLMDIDRLAPKEKGDIGCQYIVELIVNNHNGTPIDYDQISDILETHINDAVEALTVNTGHSISLGEVKFETSYSIE